MARCLSRWAVTRLAVSERYQFTRNANPRQLMRAARGQYRLHMRLPDGAGALAGS